MNPSFSEPVVLIIVSRLFKLFYCSRWHIWLSETKNFFPKILFLMIPIHASHNVIFKRFAFEMFFSWRRNRTGQALLKEINEKGVRETSPCCFLLLSINGYLEEAFKCPTIFFLLLLSQPFSLRLRNPKNMKCKLTIQSHCTRVKWASCKTWCQTLLCARLRFATTW